MERSPQDNIGSGVQDVTGVGRYAVGHPVDVASGILFTAGREVDVRGGVPLKFRRFYSTALLKRPAGPLGHGWTCNLFQTLRRDIDGFRLTGEEGGNVTFDRSSADSDDGPFLNAPACMELVAARTEAVITHWHYPGSSIIQYVFDKPDSAISALRAIRKPNGSELLLRYGANGELSEVVQVVEGRSLLVHYDDRLRIDRLTIKAPSGSVLLATYRYDKEGNLAAVGDHSGSEIRYEYDDLHRLVAETNRVGLRYEMRYDADGRCRYTSGPGGFKSRALVYDVVGLKTTVTDSRGKATIFEFNHRGQVVKETSPNGAVRTADFDTLGRMIRRADALNRSVIFSYDSFGNLAQVKEKDGGIYALEYNAAHLRIAQTEPDGNRWLWRYDEQHRLIEAENPAGAVTRYQYHSPGEGSVTTFSGGTLDYRLLPSAGGFLLSSAAGVTWRHSFDPLGHDSAIADPLGRETRLTFSPQGALTSHEAPDGALIEASVDALGRVTQWKDASNRVTYFSYDPLTERVGRLTTPGGGEVSFTYDGEGRLLGIANQAGEQARIEYDADGFVVGQTFFDGRSERYEKDLAGQLLAIVRGGGLTTKLKRNASGLVTERLWPDGTKDTYEYGPTGLLLKAANASTSVAFEYDAMGRRIAEVTEGRRVEYHYNGAGRLIRQQYVGGELGPVDLAYDEFSRLSTIAVRGKPMQQFRWDALDRVEERKLFSSVVETFAYDKPYRAVTQQVKSAAHGTLVSREYRRNKAGNLESITDRGKPSTVFEYDAGDHVTREERSGVYSAEYSYDATGNLLSKANALAPRTDLEYDAHDRLIQARLSDGSLVRYEYDPFGRRIRKVHGESITTFVWAGFDLIAEQSSYGLREFLNFGFVSLGESSGGKLFASVLSPRLQPTELIDESGRCAWTGAYNSFGQVMSETENGYTTNLRGPGQYQDVETGLQYNILRYFDPSAGRFTTPDPIGLHGGLNPYTFPKNVLNWIDPFGLECGRTDIIHFGQKAVSPEFSSGGDYKGATLDSLAEDLRANPEKVDNIQINYIVDPVTGEKITVNNRSLTVISMAGLTPTNTNDVTGQLPTEGPDTQAAVDQRMSEIGGRGRTSIGVRPSGGNWDTPPERTVPLPGS